MCGSTAVDFHLELSHFPGLQPSVSNDWLTGRSLCATPTPVGAALVFGTSSSACTRAIPGGQKINRAIPREHRLQLRSRTKLRKSIRVQKAFPFPSAWLGRLPVRGRAAGRGYWSRRPRALLRVVGPGQVLVGGRKTCGSLRFAGPEPINSQIGISKQTMPARDPEQCQAYRSKRRGE